MDGEEVCRLCHEECKFGCTGISNKDCINENVREQPFFKDCNTVQYELEFGRCLTECPTGYFVETVTIESVTFDICSQ